MCGMMVIGMSSYNLLIAGHFSPRVLALGFTPGFIVAFLVDWFIVGPIAKKLAFRIPIDKQNPVQVALSISGFMLLGMVSIMSCYGLLISQGMSALSISAYLQVWLQNFIGALPLNLLIVGPIARWILGTLQAKNS